MKCCIYIRKERRKVDFLGKNKVGLFLDNIVVRGWVLNRKKGIICCLINKIYF